MVRKASQAPWSWSLRKSPLQYRHGITSGHGQAPRPRHWWAATLQQCRRHHHPTLDWQMKKYSNVYMNTCVRHVNILFHYWKNINICNSDLSVYLFRWPKMRWIKTYRYFSLCSAMRVHWMEPTRPQWKHPALWLYQFWGKQFPLFPCCSNRQQKSELISCGIWYSIGAY